MTISDTNIAGLLNIKPDVFEDNRGAFIKTFHFDLFKSFDFQVDWKEEYFSISNKNVLRGMHFQIPPYEHDKIVTCIEGKVLDVVIDLRKNSLTYNSIFSVELSSENKTMLLIPKGCAHGFLSLVDNSIMYYKVSTVYNAESDHGILWDSIGFNWPVKSPIISERDKKHPSLTEYYSPF